MAEEIITREQLIDASKDAESLQKFISGSDIEDVLTRLGQIYPTLAKLVRILMETGGWKAYETEAILLATTPLVNPSVGYAFDTKKLYLWNGTGWIDEGLSQLDQAKDYINKNLLLLLNSILGLNNSIQITDKAVSDLSENQLQIKQENKDLSVGLQCLAESISFLIKTDDVELDDLLILQSLANEFAKLDGFDPDLSNGITQTIDGLYTLPEPKSIVKINLITSDIIPAAKGDVKNGSITIDIDGQILRTACQYEVQGSSSALYPKKNLTFGFFADENYEDEVLVKIGELLPHQELVFKANWIDHTHTRNTGANRIWEQMQHSRKTHPLRDIDHSYIGASGIGALDTGALGHVKGYPCVVYVNEDFYGLGDLNIGKKRQNYNLPKNKPEKIFLELNHWTEISVLDTVNTGWNGSLIVEIKTPSTVTVQTQQFIQQLRDFSLLNQTDFNAAIGTKLDKNNIIDFMLFVDFIAAMDLVAANSNEVKNFNLISWNGTKWFFMPYDLDTVFGLRYDGTIIDTPPTTSFMNGTFWTKIKTAYSADIEARYAELRANIFTVNNVAMTLRDLTSKYSTELYTTELTKWPTLPSINVTSMNQILEWTNARIAYLDSKYNFSA